MKFSINLCLKFMGFDFVPPVHFCLCGIPYIYDLDLAFWTDSLILVFRWVLNGSGR